MSRLIQLLLLFSIPVFSFSQNYQADWSSLDTRPTPEWWLDAKFGIIVHWGVYSVPAYSVKGKHAAWYQHALENNSQEGRVRAYHLKNYGNRSYFDLANNFQADLFEPDEWAKLFEKAGAKYVVLSAKHHDGFCLWPNTLADNTWGGPWNAASIGPRRDLVGDLFTALQRTSIKPGVYFSLYEWYNRLWLQDRNAYALNHMLPQLHELVMRYQPWVLWTDGDQDAGPETWRSTQFLAWLYNESPVRNQIVANDRWGSGIRLKHGGVFSTEYQYNLDFENHPWEESRAIGSSFGHNRAEDAGDYSSAQTLVLHLVDKVARGGNFLLSIGPDEHGKIPPLVQERLLEVGKWLEINGEAIYGARRWRIPFQWSDGKRDLKPEQTADGQSNNDFILKQTVSPPSGYAAKELFYTYNPKTNALYAIFPKYPADNRVVLKDILLPKTAEAVFLASKQRLRIEPVGRNTVIYLPGFDMNANKSPHAFAIKIPNYGAYVAEPVIQVQYEPQSMRPIVSMSCPTPGATIRYTADGTAPTEQSATYFQPTVFNEARTIRARAFKTGLMASRVDSAAVKPYPLLPSLSMFRQPEAGLQMELVRTDRYSSQNLQYAPVLKRAVVSVIEPDPVCLTGDCGMMWKGYLYIPETYGHQFFLESDDGSQLQVDGQLVVDNEAGGGMSEKSGYALLQKGWHQLRITYFNNGGAGGLRVSYAPVNGSRQALPAKALAH